jgi:hypothetical protein
LQNDLIIAFTQKGELLTFLHLLMLALPLDINSDIVHDTIRVLRY